MEQGCRGVKIKIGLDDLGRDIQRIRRIRELIPSDIEFMVDANMEWGRCYPDRSSDGRPAGNLVLGTHAT